MKEKNSKRYVKIAKKGDYKVAYDDFIAFEKGFEDVEVMNLLSFESFMEEFSKGYGNSENIQIARLLEDDNGIWYDNEYIA